MYKDSYKTFDLPSARNHCLNFSMLKTQIRISLITTTVLHSMKMKVWTL